MKKKDLIQRFTRIGNFVLGYKRVFQWIGKAKPKKKHKVKMIRCQYCEQQTIVDQSGCCQWCHYPLSTKPFKERKKKVKEPKEPKPAKEKPIVVKTPFALSCAGCLVVLAVVVLLLAGVSYGLLMTEALDDVLGSNDIYLQIKSIVNPPKPNVVSEDAYVTGLGEDYTIVIRSKVINEGGSGYVIVNVSLRTPERSIEKSTVVYLKSGRTEIVEVFFPEVSTPWLQMILRGLFGDIGGALQELTHPDIHYDVWAESER